MGIHLHQLGSTTVVDTTKLRDGELGHLLGALTQEATTRIQSRKEQRDKLKEEQVKFLIKCRNLTHTVAPKENETDTDKPLEIAYQLLESVVLKL